MGHRAAAREGAAGFERGPKWLTVEKGEAGQTLRIDSSTLETMLAHGNNKIGLVSVFGRARTGKSFLMNKLAGRPGLFEVRAGHESTTVGADLSSIASARAVADAAGAGAAMATGFVDVEGQGVEGDGYDVLLVAPLLLVSKVVVFNWSGKLVVHDMLKTIGVVTQAAEAIKLEGDATDRERCFGHLHIAMRDQADITGVRDKLVELQEPCVDEAARERNKIRKILKDSFASCSVWGLPPPMESAERLFSGKFTEADVTPAFEAKIEELKAVVMQQLATPRALCGRVLSAADVAQLMPLLAEAANEGQKEFTPLSYFAQIEQRQAETAAKAEIAAFDRWKEGLHDMIPMSPVVLLDTIEAEQQQGVSSIEAKLTGIAQDIREQAVGRLADHVGLCKEVLVRDNEKKIDLAVDAAKADAFETLEDIGLFFTDHSDPEDEDDLLEEFTQRKATVIAEFDEAVGGLGNAAAVKQGRDDVESKADATWNAIARYNRSLSGQHATEEREAQRRHTRLLRVIDVAERLLGIYNNIPGRRTNPVPGPHVPVPNPVPMPARVPRPGYKRDRNNRWHGPTGIFVKESEVFGL